ncbi:MAG: DNA repair and recombination protein RadA [Candidatus Heimdallarchaeota archaeon]|nr:DNA repair and recombination protein RadA [Candidatus Heimdallarchaeota archaeon]MCK4769050.1 DNA repair and recombination protein RadA [Candidatus Heimdallarchaeota archaeon]
MSKKADPPKSTKQATSKTPAEKKKPKEAEDWIAEIIPKKKKPSVQKLNDDDLSDVIVNKIPGIGPAVSEKLMSAGYITLAAVAHASPYELVEHCEIGEQTAKRLITAARSQIGVGFKTAKTLLESRQKLQMIPTGSKALDTLLKGGIETSSLTEISGEFRTGKTQICFQLCVITAMEKKNGGLDSGVIFIDTEGTFRPERIVQICNRFGANPDDVLSRIHVGRAYNSDHQMVLVLESPRLIKEKNVKLMIIDSLTSHFRAEFTGRGALLERQQKLNKYLHQLLRLGEVYDIAIVATNQVLSKPDVLYGETIFPIGGHIVAHSCTTRIFLRKGKGDKRIARVIDSPHIPEIETVFSITEDGIVDIEDSG